MNLGFRFEWSNLVTPGFLRAAWFRRPLLPRLCWQHAWWYRIVRCGTGRPVWDWQAGVGLAGRLAGAGSATVYRAQLKAAARLHGVGLDSALAQHFIPRRNGVGRRNASDRDSESGLAIGPGWRGGMPGDFGLQVEGFAHQSNENSESVLSRIVRRFCLGTSSVS